jgi:hypothetical protein
LKLAAFRPYESGVLPARTPPSACSVLTDSGPAGFSSNYPYYPTEFDSTSSVDSVTPSSSLVLSHNFTY